MTPYTRVSWKEGMFLSPQHFQQLERNLEAAAQLRFDGLNPLGWGILDLQVDEAALTQGRLELLRCQGVLPDGTVIDIPRIDPAPPPRSFALPEKAADLEVYLTLPVARSNASLISRDPGRADVRYHEVVADLPDSADPAAQEPVDLAVKNLRLALSGEPLEALSVLHIARVYRTPEGIPALRPDFIPPCLRLGASPALTRLAQHLIATVTARARSLHEERFRHDGEHADFDAANLQRFWFLHTLNCHGLVLQHLVDLPGTHPATLYGELLRLTGSLTTFAPPGSRLPPAYHHERLTECFTLLDRILRELLGRLFTTRFEIIDLNRSEHYWIGHIGDEDLRHRGAFFLAARSSLPQAELVSKLPSACKIADVDHIGRLIRVAVGGVRLNHIARPPSAIPARADASYFVIEADGPEWNVIRETGNIAVYVPTWLPDVSLELVGLRARPAENPGR